VFLALGIARTPDFAHFFVLGLVAGSLSFGGAYTSIPFVQAEAVVLGRWLPQQVFIDCIAIGNILPAPLVIFAIFVGFQGGYVHGGLGYAFAGATVITIGMLSPCLIFTIIGHHVLETLVRNKVCQCLPTFPYCAIHISLSFLSSAVPQCILRRNLWLHRRRNCHHRNSNPRGDCGFQGSHHGVLVVASHNAVAAVLYMLALSVLYMSTHKYTSILLVLCSALAGQFLFV